MELTVMTKERSIFFMVLILLSCLISPPSAFSQSKSFSLILSGGVLTDLTFGKLLPLPNTADVPEITVLLESKSPVLGLGLGYQMNDRLELRANLSYNRAEIVDDVGIGFAGIPLGKTKVDDADCLQYTGNIIYYFFLQRLSLFLIGGAGGITLNTSELGSSTKLFLEFGAGMRFKIARKLSAFLDFKDQMSFFNYPEDFDVFFVAIYDPDFSKYQHRLGVRFSLSYRL